MSYFVTTEQANQVLSKLLETYDVYAPKRFPKQGRFSDTDIIRYAKVEKVGSGHDVFCPDILNGERFVHERDVGSKGR